MRHKRILIALFIAALLATGAFIVRGEFSSSSSVDKPALAIKTQKADTGPFLPPGVPRRVAGEFAEHFQSLNAATEAKRLPDIHFQTIGGRKTRYSDFEGKPVLVNFWATWCAPCVVELPSLQKFKDHHAGRLQVVAVALETGAGVQKLPKFLENHRLDDFAGYVDADGALAPALALAGVPTSYLLASDGTILYRFEGDADWMSPESLAFFDIFLLQKR